MLFQWVSLLVLVCCDFVLTVRVSNSVEMWSWGKKESGEQLLVIVVMVAREVYLLLLDHGCGGNVEE